MKIVSTTPEFTFDDVLLLSNLSEYTTDEEPRVTSLKSRISRTITLDLPIMSAPMPGISGVEMAKVMAECGGIGVLHPFRSMQSQLEDVRAIKARGLRVSAAVMDLTDNGFEHVSNLHKAGCDLISVESLQAHNTQTIDFIRRIKDAFADIDVSVGVVITPDACEDLINAGADSVRVGIGGGSHCTTRLMTGVGRPQLSTLHACYEVTQEHGIPLLSDTGIRFPGDVVKAMVFGADGVMIGGMLAGTDECPGDVVERNGAKFKRSWGMCTITAIKHEQDYGGTEVDDEKEERLFQEGVQGLIAYKGSSRDVLARIASGVRRSMWYQGATNIHNLRENARVVLTSSNTLIENHPRINGFLNGG